RSGYMPEKLKEVSETYAIPYWSLIVFAIIGAILTFLTAPVHAIYSLLEDAVVSGYLAFATLPVAMLSARRKGLTPNNYRLPVGWLWSGLAFISASLIAFWSGWPSVPYAIAIGIVASIVFGFIFKVKGDFKKSIWYVVYLIFILIMTYIGSDGALNIIGFIPSTIIVAVVSVFIFLPWGLLSS
ncbi:MAG: amino acid transporter, partial [Caldisphaera sp.]